MSDSRPLKVYTLCFVREQPRILLGMKKARFGEGKWNGFGGKVEDGETIEEGVRRELREEASIDVTTMEKAGTILCAIQSESFVRDIRVFRASGIVGEPVETEEMRPLWFDESAIPYDLMWPDAALWLPYLLRAEAFVADLEFDAALRMVRSDVRAA